MQGEGPEKNGTRVGQVMAKEIIKMGHVSDR